VCILVILLVFSFWVYVVLSVMIITQISLSCLFHCVSIMMLNIPSLLCAVDWQIKHLSYLFYSIKVVTGITSVNYFVTLKFSNTSF